MSERCKQSWLIRGRLGSPFPRVGQRGVAYLPTRISGRGADLGGDELALLWSDGNAKRYHHLPSSEPSTLPGARAANGPTVFLLTIVPLSHGVRHRQVANGGPRALQAAAWSGDHFCNIITYQASIENIMKLPGGVPS